ncbi:MAG: isoleucine--tRNA ligase [Spirochaetaceae bacterium]|nr:isoleucine--tRNA ligase [Spirochaetaceae bacterium]
MFKPVDTKVNFPKMEEKILQFWKENNIFQKSIDYREDCPEYVFYDGPPFATGLPHFGHFVPGTIKDIIPRYQTMKGKKVNRRFGWDCHGLPVEYEIEKDLGISGKSQIEEYGVAKFNERCRSIVLRYTTEWQEIVSRLGRWVDFENDYKTMDPDYMESIWWVFKTLWEKGLVYEGYNILPYSPALSSPLSNFEVNLGGYQNVVDPAITVKFSLKNEPKTYFLAWTTTPWTLTSNLALVLGPEINYVKVLENGNSYILAASKVSNYFKDETTYEITGKFKGKDLTGIEYEPLMPFFSHLSADGAFRTFTGDYVTEEDGCGIVHTAPGFGEDDYRILQPTGIPVVCPIDAECRFTDEVPNWKGLFVKDADESIIEYLEKENKLIKKEKIKHSYPFCYRTKKPLIYRALSCWFVNVTKIKSAILNANDQINWIPEHLKHGRFGKWLEGARDWAISRNRYWGNPIPVWKSDGSSYFEVIGSIKELQEKSGVLVEDLHKHFVDEITWPSPDGKGTMRRIPDVLDCWFESGSMPYAQNHFPFENKDFIEKHFPADFICEGLDQTRGWFYTLTILGAALFGSPAFRHVVVNGLVLAEDGKKMSKSLKNYTDPGRIIDQFGADALRLFLMDSAVVKGESLRYSDGGVRDVLKKVLLPLWNAYSFYVTYANIDGIRPTEIPTKPSNPLDRWILSETGLLISRVGELLDAYDIQKAIEPILGFIDALNNWYIRRSRRRFWKSTRDGEGDTDKQEAYATLRAALITLAKVASPFVPFISDEIYLNLRSDEDPESVHLCDWPEASLFPKDEMLGMKMDVTRRTVSLGRALRNAHELKIRQPLKSLYVVTRNKDEKAVLFEMAELLAEELNVKDVHFRENEEELVEYSAKANFKVLGRKLGKDMKVAAARIAILNPGEIQSLMEGAILSVEFEGSQSNMLELTSDSVEVRRSEKAGLKVLNEGSLTVALDPEITPELKAEGIVRDLVRGIQNLRKDSGFEVTDRITVRADGPEVVRNAVDSFEKYLRGETLSESFEWKEIPVSGNNTTVVAVGDLSMRIAIKRI